MNTELSEKGYLPVKGLLEPSLAGVLYKTLLLKHWRGECFRDIQVPTAASVANAAETDALLLEVRPKLEALTGIRLVPSYTYSRLYFRGDVLVPHTDRPACEVTVSVHLGRDGGEGAIWFPPNTKVEMEPGDGAVFFGCEVEHWRERFDGNSMGQIFLHYIIANGPRAAHYFDGNPLRFPPSIVDTLTA